MSGFGVVARTRIAAAQSQASQDRARAHLEEILGPLTFFVANRVDGPEGQPQVEIAGKRVSRARFAYWSSLGWIERVAGKFAKRQVWRRKDR